MNSNKKEIQKILARAEVTVGGYFQLYKSLEGFLKKVVPKPSLDCCNDHVLLEYIHDLLTDEKESIVLDHLRQCPRCATAVMLERRQNTIWDQACVVDQKGFFTLLCDKIIINPRRLLE